MNILKKSKNKNYKWQIDADSVDTRCVICDSCDLEYHEAEFAPFVKERMFDNKDDKTDLIHCKKCNFYYSSNRPSDEHMAKYYNGYRDENYQSRRQFFEPRYTPELNYSLGFSLKEKVIRNEIILNVLNKYIDYNKIENVLDYGGDAGQYIPESFENSQKYVYDISGVEPVAGVNKIKKDELSHKKWDFIMCCHVLEHVSYPMQIIREIFNLLSDGGYLYIEVPYEYIEHDNCNYVISVHEHINRFRIETFRKIFEKPNVKILDISYVDIPKTESKNLVCLIQKVETKDHSNSYEFANLENKITLLSEQIKCLRESCASLEKDNFAEKIFSIKKKGDKVIFRIFFLKFAFKKTKEV